VIASDKSLKVYSDGTVEGGEWFKITGNTKTKIENPNPPTEKTNKKVFVRMHDLGSWTQVNRNGMGAGPRAYQEQITGRRFNGNLIEEYEIDGVKFDGYNASEDVLLDAKGDYSIRTQPWGEANVEQGFLDEAQRQLNVAQGTKIEWHFAFEDDASYCIELFENNNIEGIDIIYTRPNFTYNRRF